MSQKKDWSNELTAASEVDREVQRRTPRERHIDSLIEQNKDVKPELCDVTSKNGKALRVIHDYYGTIVSIPPNETKKGVSLHPNAIAYFKNARSDLEVVPAA
jgi:hypothetical protein